MKRALARPHSTLLRLVLLSSFILVLSPPVAAEPCAELRGLYQQSASRLQENQLLLLRRGCLDGRGEDCQGMISAFRELQSATLMLVQRLEQLECSVEGPTRSATPCERIARLAAKSEEAMGAAQRDYERRCRGARRRRRRCRGLAATLEQRRRVWRATQAREREMECAGSASEEVGAEQAGAEQAGAEQAGAEQLDAEQARAGGAETREPRPRRARAGRARAGRARAGRARAGRARAEGVRAAGRRRGTQAEEPRGAAQGECGAASSDEELEALLRRHLSEEEIESFGLRIVTPPERDPAREGQ